MTEEKQVLDFFKKIRQSLKENFEVRYGFTDRKRAIDHMIDVFPNGLEVVVCNIKEIKGSNFSMIIKYDPNSLKLPLKYHGDFKLKNVKELESLISDLFNIKWNLELDEKVISTEYSDKNCHYFYVKNKEPLSDALSFFFNITINTIFSQMFELSVKGFNDQIYSVELKDIEDKYRKVMKLPGKKSHVVFDLPFEMVLDKDRYKFN